LTNCTGCVYDTRNNNGCEAFIEKPENCWNNTTEAQRKQREKEMKIYHGEYNEKHGGEK